MQHPCKHCAQLHHANSVMVVEKFTNSGSTTSIRASDMVGDQKLYLQRFHSAEQQQQTTGKTHATSLNRFRQSAPTSPVASTATKMPSNVFNDECNTEQPDSTIAFGNYHRRTIANAIRTCRWLNGNDGAKSGIIVSELHDAEKFVGSDRQIISISGARRQSHANRTVTCPSTPQIQPPSTCIQSETVHSVQGAAYELASTRKAAIGVRAQVSVNRPMSTAVGLFQPANSTTPMATSILQPCSPRKSAIKSQTNKSQSPVCFKPDQCSSNGFEFHRTQNRWLTATTISHVLLFCMVFVVFGIGSRGGMVNADDLPNNSTNVSKINSEDGSKYLIHLYIDVYLIGNFN